MTEERVVIGREQFAVLLAYEPGGGYEWSQAALLRRIEDGQLFYLSESGCSCNAPFSDTLPDDLEPVASWQEAAEKAKGDSPGYLTEEEAATFAQRLAELRPASSQQAARP